MSTAEVHGWLVEWPGVRSCVVCGRPTNLVDYTFGVSVCRGTCTASMRVDAWVGQARKGRVSARQRAWVSS